MSNNACFWLGQEALGHGVLNQASKGLLVGITALGQFRRRDSFANGELLRYAEAGHHMQAHQIELPPYSAK